MKKITVLFLCIITVFSIKAQTQNPVKWMATYKALSATEGEIKIVATIDNNWHTYSQRPTDAGPIATTISFTPSKQFQLVGKTEELNAHEEFDKAFDATLYIFYNKAEFIQKVKLTGKAGFAIPFKIEYTCCNDKMCLPPTTVELSVKTQ